MVTSSRIASREAQMEAMNLAAMYDKDPLANARTHIFDEAAMAKILPEDVCTRFKECCKSGAPTPEDDQALIAEAMFRWARELGATDFAHWFFPIRGGSGAVGGMLGALKYDALIDLDWGSKQANKPFKSTFPSDRLFVGETDGSSFPNGGLRVTHQAAAFTTWDRTSPPFLTGKTLRIPSSFITHYGKCIDDKTPLLRSQDAINVQGKRVLKLTGIEPEATCIYSYLGWEQEFFVIDAELYKKRPDLVNCGRTLIGQLPKRNQQGDLNYFGPVPGKVEKLMVAVQAEMLKVGSPMSVRHNEVAPGQHEMSPIFCVANASADSNVYFMEVCTTIAQSMGLVVLFHEKPFAGINGSGKHANWSIGTDTGLNFFYPGKTDPHREAFVTGVACLSWGLKNYNELVRCAVAHAGNDHRLGAQEAPPAIISLYPGTGFEAHVDKILEGGTLLGYEAKKGLAVPGCRSSMAIPTNVEDRNRTAPFPFCSNRFEFRAVGSSQNCAFPVMIVNTIMAAGLKKCADLMEGGMSHCDAVRELYKESREVIFTGNGYSKEWPEEAAKRGLPNLNTTPLAVPEFASEKNIAVFDELNIFSKEETEARTEIMYENYNTTLKIEAETLITMVSTGILPACAKDIAAFAAAPTLAGDRAKLYSDIKDSLESLKKFVAETPEDLAAEAVYLCETIKPAMNSLRALVDQAEGTMESALYPFPTYDDLLFGHHF